MTELPKLIATSVVRGSEKGQSHGGVFIIDFKAQAVEQKLDSFEKFPTDRQFYC